MQFKSMQAILCPIQEEEQDNSLCYFKHYSGVGWLEIGLQHSSTCLVAGPNLRSSPACDSDTAGYGVFRNTKTEQITKKLTTVIHLGPS